MRGKIPDLFDRRLPFSSAVALADVPPKPIRNWIDRRQLTFLDEIEDRRDGEDWRRYSIFDAIRFSIAKHIVDFGVAVEFASHTAMGTFQGEANVAFLQGCSENAILKRLGARTVYVWREGSGWSGGYGSAPPTGMPPSFLTVNVRAIAQRVFDRLADYDD